MPRKISHNGWSTHNPEQEKLALYEAAYLWLRENGFTEQCRDKKDCIRLTCFFSHDEERGFEAWCKEVKGFKARDPSQHPRHKTVECDNWAIDGKCPYDDHCVYIHTKEGAAAAAATTAAA
jgi:hypothetical protein